MMEEQIIFDESIDASGHRTVTARSFPERIRVTPELLGAADKTFMRAFIEISATNGRAVYEITGCEVSGQIAEGIQTLTAKRVVQK